MFLKFGSSAVPLEQVRQISIWYGDDVEVKYAEDTSVRKKVKKLKLRIEFSDRSAWNIDLSPEPKDREAFLEKLLREINRRVVTDVPAVVKRLLEKDKGSKKTGIHLEGVHVEGDVAIGENVLIKKTYSVKTTHRRSG